ncbi:hypothetical protein SAMN05192553_101124 [Cyclobacterium xiamenense]|uniref:Uncharacterized protein n=1 Tax=Cyclobacterium xiamenense TaxID=1297121 RepID=A0A1H6TH21_9BACT|nr:hypothetical protein SAMN05192553_101124 [Cyclobacterium xiamenense]
MFNFSIKALENKSLTWKQFRYYEKNNRKDPASG